MNKILINDMSLRSFDCHDAFTMSFKEKLEIAKRLDELNVDVIELGPVSSEKSDEVLIKTICACVRKATISCVSGNTVDDIEKINSLTMTAKKKRILFNIPVSPVQMEYSLGKKPKAVLELLETLVKKARTLFDDVEVSFDDSTRAEKEFLYSAIRIALSNGVNNITIVDKVGSTLPGEFGDFIKGIYENVPELKNANLAVSCNDEMSLATACVFSGIMAGAKTVKISALENSNSPLVLNFVNAMDTIGIKKGFTCNINKTAVSRIIKQISQFSVKENDNSAFTTLSDESVNNLPESFTLASLKKIIKKLGYSLSDEDIKKVFEETKRVSTKKTISTKELDVIIANTALQVPETYILKSFSVNSSNILTATASIVLQKKDKELMGLSYGNGSVDAAFLALENITGRHFELDGFELGAVTEGKEAMGQALVKLRNDGKIYSGRGVSTDIVGASIRAYVNALNKIVYEEEN